MTNEKIKEIPIVNLRMMSDEEWNRLAYKNYLQRKGREENGKRKN